MKRPFNRSSRLESLFKHEIAQQFLLIKSPVIENQIVQITELRLSKDLSSVRAYVSVMDKDAEVAVVSLLQDKAGWMRSNLGKKLHLKKIPKIIFIQDDSLARTSYINALLEQNRHEDV